MTSLKKWIKQLARLYPSAWRERYGAEFDALLEDIAPSTRDAFDTFFGAIKMQIATRGFSGITVACSLFGMVFAVLLSFTMPMRYQSLAIVQASPVADATGHLLQRATEVAFTEEFLASVIQKDNLYSRKRARVPLDQVVANMKRHIRVHLMPQASSESSNSLTFVLQVDYADARVAEQVNKQLEDRLMETNFDLQVASIRARKPNSPLMLRVPTLPSFMARTVEPNRIEYGAIGLLTGLLLGLFLEILLRSRSGRPAPAG